MPYSRMSVFLSSIAMYINRFPDPVLVWYIALLSFCESEAHVQFVQEDSNPIAVCPRQDTTKPRGIAISGNPL